MLLFSCRPQVYPEFRQAESLLEHCEKEIIKVGAGRWGAALCM